jgi:hypothetical protein
LKFTVIDESFHPLMLDANQVKKEEALEAKLREVVAFAYTVNKLVVSRDGCYPTRNIRRLEVEMCF